MSITQTSLDTQFKTSFSVPVTNTPNSLPAPGAPFQTGLAIDKQKNYSHLTVFTDLQNKTEKFITKYKDSQACISKDELLEIVAAYWCILSTPATISAEQLRRVYFSLFLESELTSLQLPQDILQRIEAPDTMCTIFLLSQFLRQYSQYHSCKLYSSLVTQCEIIMSIIKLAQTELRPCSQVVQKWLVENMIVPAVEKLAIDHHIAIPSGWISLPDADINGHFILTILKRQTAVKYKRIVINSHPLCTKAVISEEIIEHKNIPALVHELVGNMFENTLKQRLNTAIKTSTAYTYLEKKVLGNSVPFKDLSALCFPAQKGTQNCIFMAFYILFALISEPEDNADAFRLEFIKTLENVLVHSQ